MPLEKQIFIPKLNQEIEFVVGKNAQENFDIIEEAEPHDIWFHVEGMPSCHVIAKVARDFNKKELAPIIKQGCLLCKIQSKYANIQKLPIVYTKVKDVEKLERVGSVALKNEKTMVI
jgi:predicted ribosome quality control (RQC) complex YloA/Tae2 family protein